MVRVVVLLMAIGCGAPARRAPAPRAPAPPARPVAPRPAPDAPPPSPHRFVEAELGLDLRALPTGSTPDMIDTYVLAQGDDLRALAPAGVDVEIRHVPGWGVLVTRFRAPELAAAHTACERTVAAYLAHAPQLPVIHAPGAQLTTPCHDVSE